MEHFNPKYMRVFPVQTCSQFDSKGNHCRNQAELLDGFKDMPLDFCPMHNHMMKDGLPVKCWRCGDR